MAKESVNGSGPASSNGSGPSDDDNAKNGTEFERFERLTRQILAVPKAELDKRRGRAKNKSS